MCGVGTLASPSSRFRVRLPPCQGDASVPTLHPSHSRPYETNPLPSSFIPSLLLTLIKKRITGEKALGNNNVIV